MRIAYLDGPRLRRSLLAACEYIQEQRRELNRINVFPVPDGDTGTNLSLTVQAIADHLRKNKDRGFHAVAHEAAQAAVLGARGNAGMMLSHFLLGFAAQTQGMERICPKEFGAGPQRRSRSPSQCSRATGGRNHPHGHAGHGGGRPRNHRPRLSAADGLSG